MRYENYTLTQPIAYTASTQVPVNLPRNGYITEIDCIMVANITASNTITPATTDPMQQLVSSARINAAGETYFDVSDGRDWWHWANMRHRGCLQLGALPAAGATATIVVLFPIHLGFNPKNPFDPTVVIPARRLSNPQLTIGWGAANTIGSGYDINSCTMRLNICELVLEGTETERDTWPNGLLVPRVENATEPLDTAHTNRGLRHQVPVSLVLYQTMVLIIDADDDRSNTPVTELSVELPPERETPVQITWTDLMAINAKRTECMSLISAEANRAPYAGAHLLQWPLVSGNPRGIDLTRKRVGDVELGFTNAATSGGVVRLLHVGYQPE